MIKIVVFVLDSYLNNMVTVFLLTKSNQYSTNNDQAYLFSSTNVIDDTFTFFTLT